MEGYLSSLWSGRAWTKQSTSKYLEILPEDFLYLCESSYFKDGSLLDFVSLWSICIILIHILKTSVSQCDNANRKHQRAHHLEGSCKKSKEEGAMLERRGIQLSGELNSFVEGLACNERVLCPLLLNSRFWTMTTSYLTSRYKIMCW